MLDLVSSRFRSQIRSEQWIRRCRKHIHSLKIPRSRCSAKFTGINLCQSLFFNKVKKRDSGTGVFLRILPNFQEPYLLQNTSGGCFWRPHSCLKYNKFESSLSITAAVIYVKEIIITKYFLNYHQIYEVNVYKLHWNVISTKLYSTTAYFKPMEIKVF